MNFQMIFVLSIALLVGSAFSLRCYVCEDESCNKLKDLEPRNCTREILNNVGPGLISFTQMFWNPEITSADPPFECQKVEAIDSNNGNIHVARRCQVQLPANNSCDHFLRTIGNERDYRNASCQVCTTDSCNKAENVKVWSMLLASTLLFSGLFVFIA